MAKLADAGDEVAAAVLKKEGEKLGWLVRLVIRRLQPAMASGSDVLAMLRTLRLPAPLWRTSC